MLKNKREFPERQQRGKVRFLSTLSFVLGFLDAYYLFVLSSYFVAVSGSDNVGSFYFFAFGLVFLSLLRLGSVIQRFGRVRLLFLLLVALIGSTIFLSLAEPSWSGVFFLLLFLVLNNVMWVVMDVILESYSTDRVSGRVRGLYLTITNAGFLFAPWLAAQTLNHFGFGGIFTGLTLGYALVLVAALLGLERRNHVGARHFDFVATWRRIVLRPNLLRIYHVSFALEFFYAIMIVFTPLYLLEKLGFGWDELGIIFTIMLIPFVLFQYPLGVMADRRYGEKEFLIGSLFLMAASTALVGIIEERHLLAWGAVLFLTRIGAAAIEILRDSYFYKQISADDADIIAFFRTARPLANVFSAFLTTLLLLVFPMRSTFFLVVMMALLAAVSAIWLKDSESEYERRQAARR